ncbi:kinase-like protein [Stereum hirsutum FP-91666 SS1]|uniref:kinase-like protein n=1 Tax=Stereum hirsutum (strain FP-91666) TaxID=721885 RepID=UPI000440E45B|nr:kinase-like protein [Stereum hirsutum FP-91666 SS1]EIM87050.1 kinase-like protein [Stereum hirsutum FP-91666 SS1]
MDFIARHTSIPVPRVHDAFSARGETWLVMEYIDAPLLIRVWRNLSEHERLSAMQQLKGYIDQLRSLEPPEPGKVQAVDGTGCIDSRMASEPWGPFHTISDFHTFFGHDYKTSGRVYRTVFTHGDLGPHNILWKDGKIAAIIDWETAGWLPEYWEYTRSHESIPEELRVEQDLGSVLTRI